MMFFGEGIEMDSWKANDLIDLYAEYAKLITDRRWLLYQASLLKVKIDEIQKEMKEKELEVFGSD